MYRGMYVKKRRPKPVAPISIDDEPRGIFAPGSFPLDEPPPVSLQAQRRRAVQRKTVGARDFEYRRARGAPEPAPRATPSATTKPRPRSAPPGRRPSAAAADADPAGRFRRPSRKPAAHAPFAGREVLHSPQGAALTGERAGRVERLDEGFGRVEAVGGHIESLTTDLARQLVGVDATVEEAREPRPAAAPAARPRFRTVRQVVRGEHVAKRDGREVPLRAIAEAHGAASAPGSDASTLTPDGAPPRRRDPARRGAVDRSRGARSPSPRRAPPPLPGDDARAEVRRGTASKDRWRPPRPPPFGSFYAHRDGPPVGTYDVTYNVDHVATARKGDHAGRGPMKLSYPTGKAAPNYTMTGKAASYGHSRTHSNWMMQAIAHAESMPGPGAYQIPSSVARPTANARAVPGGAGTLSRSGRF